MESFSAHSIAEFASQVASQWRLWRSSADLRAVRFRVIVVNTLHSVIIHLDDDRMQSA